MKNSVKKILGVAAIVLALPLFVGGNVACAKSCQDKCADYNKTCSASGDCAASCTEACKAVSNAAADCTGSDCSCTADPAGAGCAALLMKCQSQYAAVATCLTPA
jgi:hypothetical protein